MYIRNIVLYVDYIMICIHYSLNSIGSLYNYLYHLSIFINVYYYTLLHLHQLYQLYLSEYVNYFLFFFNVEYFVKFIVHFNC